MKLLLILCKNELIKVSKVNQLRYSEDTKQREKIMCLYLLVFIVIIGIIVYYVQAICNIFSIFWAADDIINRLIVPITFICLIINIVISVFWGSGLLLFDTNVDAQLVLPIHLYIIICSRLFVLYLFLAILNTMLLFPMDVLFGITAGEGILFYIISMGNILLSPIIPCLAGVIIGIGVYCILRNPSVWIARLKTIFTGLFLLVFIVFMFLKYSDTMKETMRFGHTKNTLYMIVHRYVESLLYYDMVSLVIYYGIIFSSGFFILQGLKVVYERWYCTANSQKKKTVDISAGMFYQNSVVSTLIIRERRRYFSTLAYFTNTALGFLLAVTFVLLVVVANEKIISYVALYSSYFQVGYATADMLYIFVFTIVISLSNTTYASISIEGKQMEVLKSLPVNVYDICKAKIWFHLSLSVPFILILNTIMASVLQFHWNKALMGYIMPLTFTTFAGVTGYICNLLFPYFEWTNATHIVKQSFPAIMSTVLVTTLTCGTTFLLLKYFSGTLLLSSFIMCIFIFLFTCIMIVWLKKHCKQFYSNY